MKKKESVIIPKGINIVNKSYVDKSYGIGSIFLGVYIFYNIVCGIIGVNAILNILHRETLDGSIKPILYIDLFVYICVTILFVAVFYMLTKKSVLFPLSCLLVLSISVGLSIVEKIIFYVMISDVIELSNHVFFYESYTKIIISLLFIVYVLKSKRLKDTF